MSTEVLHQEGHVGPTVANASGKRTIQPIFDQRQAAVAAPLVPEDSKQERFGSRVAVIDDLEATAHVSRQARDASW